MVTRTIDDEERGTSSAERPSSCLRNHGVLTSAGYDRTIRWRAGERLEHLFERRLDELAREGRSATAAVDGPHGTVSYAELDARANQLARFLALRQDVRPGDRVGLLFDYPGDSYVAMLAVLKLHAAYVPLDAAFPADRLAYVLSDAGVRMVLSQSKLSPNLDQLYEPVSVLCLDQLDAQIVGERSARLEEHEIAEPVDDLCYVIYTSGTTGRPKGVAISHPSIVNFVRVAAEVYGLRSDDRVYQGLTIAFDFSIEEIWVAWMAGAALVPKPSADPLVGPDLGDFLVAHRVTALCCVPTLLATLPEDLPGLRFLLVSGESCPDDLVERWHRPERRFLNVYGPTEATVSATWTLLDPSRPVTIGVPLPTYSVVVLDPETYRALPPGSLGELGIAGVGLADGYLGARELTERAFVPDFISMPDNPSGRIYRTGDLVRVNEDGEIEHHGRIDTQVKIRGYRIEVAEVEAVLRQIPGVAQAVVDTHEPEPGMKELVAYYTSRSRPDPAAIHATLREKLAPYMVPSYLEQLDHLPVGPTGKVDRNSLPRPRRARRVPVGEKYVCPSSELETVMAAELGTVLGVEHVSVEDHFFDHLGANSLLMARFTARLRTRAEALPPVSMRAIYLYPTIRGLAAALEEPERAEQSGTADSWEEPVLAPATGTPRYVLCGALQLLSFVVVAGLVGAALDACSSGLFAAHGLLDGYLRALGLGAGLLLGMGLLPIAAKWVLVGRFKPRSIRIWSMAYFRFWVVKTLLVMNPVPRLLVGTPLYALYLRALGARVGSRTLILSHHIPVCTDLVRVGSDSVIYKNTYLNGYRGHAGTIEIGPVTLGENAFVGEGCVLDIHSSLEASSQLGHSSSLHAGQTVPADQCWYGSPAQQAPADYDYRTVTPATSTKLRRRRYGVARLLALVMIVGPLAAAAGSALLAHPRLVERLPAVAMPVVAAAELFGLLAVAFACAVAVPRLLTRFLKPGKVYPLYGFHYTVQRLIALASNNPMLTGLLGDSSAIVHYLRLLGYRLGVVEQTGSNFGLDVKHDVPALSHVGTGTMVSDGLSIINAEFSSTSFRVVPVVIGRRSYVGNAISYPAEGRTGENCLFATKALVPIGGPQRTDVGLLGSPPFEIPRSVRRDEQYEEISKGVERERRLAQKTRHNIVTMVLHLLVFFALLVGLDAIAVSPFGGSGLRHLGGTVASAILEVCFALALFVLTERAVTGFRPQQPKCCSIYDLDYWRHERFWKVAPTAYFRVFDGTPFKGPLWRLVGVSVGARVFDDGATLTERTLVSIGGESTLNMGSNLQSHTLEDGVFKSDHIFIGRSCTVGTGALVNYGVVMEDESELEPDSFLMKGSRMQHGARWRGNPATEVWSVDRAAEAPLELPIDQPHKAGPELEAA